VILADIRPLRVSADYRRLWFGFTVSQLGQQMTTIAVAIQVYALTRSNFAVGLLGLVVLGPMVVGGLYGGAIADVMDRKLLAIAASSGLAATSLLLAIQAYADWRSSASSMRWSRCRGSSSRSTTPPGTRCSRGYCPPST